MRTTGFVVLVSLVAVVACWLVVSGWRQPRPTLVDAVERLRRRPQPTDPRALGGSNGIDRIGAYVADAPFVQQRLGSLTTLRLIGRSAHTHVGYLVVAGLLGLVAPSLAVALLVLTADASLGLAVPAGLSLLGAVLAPLAVHSAAVSTADAVRIDLRHQLSAFLDMVTMLLAGNSGHEGALEHAASAGDGLLFRELRRRMREVATTGNSLVGALALVADDFELVELEQVASATALSAAEGAPVARTLAAKCSTLRSTLSADQEAKARVRNDKVTPPLVGMALLFMALIIYPALTIG